MGEPFALAISALCSLLKHPPNLEPHLAGFHTVSNRTANRQGKTWAAIESQVIASLQPWRNHRPRALSQLAPAEQTSSPRRSSVPALEALSSSPLYVYKSDMVSSGGWLSRRLQSQLATAATSCFMPCFRPRRWPRTKVSVGNGPAGHNEGCE